MKLCIKMLTLGLIITSICYCDVKAKAVSNIKSNKANSMTITAQNITSVGTVTSSSLIVRSAPSTTSKVIGGLRVNNRVNIISLHSGWYKINFNSNVGYVYSTYIKTNYKDMNSEKQLGYITASALNMRNGPSTINNVIKTLPKGEGVVILEKKNDWLKVNSNNSTGWILATYVSNIQPAANGGKIIKKAIVIDAGHGGYDPGAIGATGLKEKDITLAVSLKLGKILENQGHTVVYTRKTDKVSWSSIVKEDLNARVEIGNKSKADLFISIHANSNKLRYPKGMETYYTNINPQSKLLAKSIQDSMVKSIGLNNRGIKEYNYYVLKNSVIPSVLVELAYISNASEEKLLKNPLYQDKWANSIAKGVNNYLTSK